MTIKQKMVIEELQMITGTVCEDIDYLVAHMVARNLQYSNEPDSKYVKPVDEKPLCEVAEDFSSFWKRGGSYE